MATDPDLASLARWLETEPGVVAAWLFGSRARGDAGPDSDTDVAVLIDASLADLDRLRLRLRWMVEAAERLNVPDDQVDLILLPDAGAFVTHAVLRDGRLLVDRDPDARIDFQVRALHRLEEARHFRDIAMRARAERFGVAQ